MRPFEYYVASHTGDGNAKTVTCGFKPRYVNVENVTDRIKDEKYESNLATETLHTVAAGTRTLDTGSLIVFTDTGFTIAAAANINAKVFHVTAIP